MSSDAPQPTTSELAEPAPAKFFVVGIGASAGGLEPITDLLKQLDLDNLAVVVVQHLAPNSDSALVSLLARSTGHPVVEARDGLALEPKKVFVIPPNADLAVLNGALHVMTLDGREGLRLPIDYFLRSLASDAAYRSIGVVLSGSGSDGTFGLKAVKDAGGLTFAQEPSTAQFADMPRHASESEWADFTLPVEGIAREINRLASHGYLSREHLEGPHVQESFGKLIVLMRNAFGNDLTYYKPSTIERRIERRMTLHKIERLDDYVKFVSSNPAELKLLYKDMLISVTSFFRDVEPFEVLKQRVFPRLLEAKSVGSQIRIWVPACSTGEEAYSFAMTLLECIDDRAHDFRIQIFGTDVDEASITFARRAVYPNNIALDVSPERLHRFFIKKDNEYQVTRRIRDMVVFSVQNVTKDPPFSRLDLASCRNLLIYLQPPMQKKVLRVLHYSLNPNAWLMLGTSETVGESSEMFTLVDRKNKLYSKRHAAAFQPMEIGPGVHAPEPKRAASGPPAPRSAANIGTLADRKILELFGPPGVVISEQLDVMHIRGRTGPYLEPMPGAPSFNILKLARPELHVDLRRAIHEAQSTGNRVSIDCRVTEGGIARPFRLEVVPIADPETKAKCMLVLFHEPADAPIRPEAPAEALSPDAQRLHELERELLVTKEYLQSTIEELESGTEELKSSNEELQSSNEELQSTNEELETSKEELQSANEELTTVNDELQNRMGELQLSNDDLYNVLAGVGNAVVIIGMDLRIRRFTQTAEKLLNLVQGDVGRSVSQLNVFIQGQRIEDVAADVIARLVPETKEVTGSDGRWYELNVAPYRTLDHSIRGAVIVLIDIDVKKRAAELGRGVPSFADELYRVVSRPLGIVNRQRNFVWVNGPFATRFEVSRDHARSTPVKRYVAEAGLELLIERAFNDGAEFTNFEVKGLRISGSRIPSIGGETSLVLLAFEEPTRGITP